MSIIMITVLLTSAIALFASFQTAASPRSNVILNTTLPREVQKDAGVQEIVSRYKKANLLVFVAALLPTPIILFFQKPSFMILYLCLWFTADILAHNRLLNIYNRKLYALKQQNQWFVGNTQTITLDLEVSREKGKMAISPVWFLPSLAIAAALLIAGLLADEITLYPGLAAMVGVLTHYYLYTLTTRERARAHSEDTQINLAITRTSIRLWTICWTGLAALHSLSMVILLLLIRSNSATAFAFVVGGIIIINLAVIFLVYSRIQDNQTLLLEQAQAPIYVDEDYYWRGGFYNNPNDCRTLVEKRIGYGQTLNLGTKKGRMAYYGLIIGLPAFLLTMFLMFLSLDTAKFDLTITDDMVQIHAPLYGYEFPLEDIESITTLKTLPSGRRTNGAATSEYSLGNFSLQGYGRSKLYVYNKQPLYIVIKLPDLYVFFNANTEEETQQYYQQLLAKIGEK